MVHALIKAKTWYHKPVLLVVLTATYWGSQNLAHMQQYSLQKRPNKKQYTGILLCILTTLNDWRSCIFDWNTQASESAAKPTRESHQKINGSLVIGVWVSILLAQQDLKYTHSHSKGYYICFTRDIQGCFETTHEMSNNCLQSNFIWWLWSAWCSRFFPFC